jgi:hypothetical protein
MFMPPFGGFLNEKMTFPALLIPNVVLCANSPSYNLFLKVLLVLNSDFLYCFLSRYFSRPQPFTSNSHESGPFIFLRIEPLYDFNIQTDNEQAKFIGVVVFETDDLEKIINKAVSAALGSL